MGQHIGADRPRLLPRFGIARCRDPDRQVFRHRAWLGNDRKHGHLGGREFDRLARPQPAQVLDRLKHCRFVGGGRVFGAQHEIIGLPARGDGKTHLAAGQVVDHCPFFGNPGGMVQRGHATAGPHRQIAGHGGDGSAGDGRVGIGAAKGVEMPLRRPDRDKAILVGKLRPVQQQLVFVPPDAIVIAPVEQAELHPPCADWSLRYQRPGLVTRHHHGKSPGQRPEQFQHRDVKRQAGHGQPDTGRAVADSGIHAGKKVRHVAVFDHHPLGPPGRAGGEDQIGQIRRANPAVRVGRRGHGNARVIVGEDLPGIGRQAGRNRSVGQDDLCARIGDIHRDPIRRIGGVERQIGGTGLLNGQRPDQQCSRPAHIQADHLPRPGPDAAQDMRQLVRRCIQGVVAEGHSFEVQRHRLRCAGHLRLKLVMETAAVVEIACRLVPASGHKHDLGRRQRVVGHGQRVFHPRPDQFQHRLRQPRRIGLQHHALGSHAQGHHGSGQQTGAVRQAHLRRRQHPTPGQPRRQINGEWPQRPGLRQTRAQIGPVHPDRHPRAQQRLVVTAGQRQIGGRLIGHPQHDPGKGRHRLIGLGAGRHGDRTCGATCAEGRQHQRDQHRQPLAPLRLGPGYLRRNRQRGSGQPPTGQGG